MPNLPEDPNEERIWYLPSQIELADSLDRLTGRFSNLGMYAVDLVMEWRKMETSLPAHMFAAVAPDLVRAIYALEVELFRNEIDRLL